MILFSWVGFFLVFVDIDYLFLFYSRNLLLGYFHDNLQRGLFDLLNVALFAELALYIFALFPFSFVIIGILLDFLFFLLLLAFVNQFNYLFVISVHKNL